MQPEGFSAMQPEGFSSERSSVRGMSLYEPVATEHPHQDISEYADISCLPVAVQKALASFDVDKDGYIKCQDLHLAGQLLKQHRLRIHYLNKLNLLGVFAALIVAAFGGSYAAVHVQKDPIIDAMHNTTFMSQTLGQVVAPASTAIGISNDVTRLSDGAEILPAGPILIDPWRHPIQVEQASYFVPVRSFAKFPLLSLAALDGIQSLQVLSNGTQYNFKVMGFELYGTHTQDDHIVCFQTASHQVVMITVTGMVYVVSERNWTDVAAYLHLLFSSGPSHAGSIGDRRLNVLQDIGNFIKKFCTAIVDVTIDLINAIIGGFKAAGNWIVAEWNKITGR